MPSREDAANQGQKSPNVREPRPGLDRSPHAVMTPRRGAQLPSLAVAEQIAILLPNLLPNAMGRAVPSRRERFSPIASPSAAHCNDGLKGRERRCHALSRFRSFYLRCEAMAAPSPLAGNYLPAYYVACDLAEWEIEI